MCSHNVHANSGRVDLNCHPKWSILGSASLRNLRPKTKCFFYLYCITFQWFSFHFWINSLFYVLSIHWKSLIWMNIVFGLVHLRGCRESFEHNMMDVVSMCFHQYYVMLHTYHQKNCFIDHTHYNIWLSELNRNSCHWIDIPTLHKNTFYALEHAFLVK
jgi:hypothetical protein